MKKSILAICAVVLCSLACVATCAHADQLEESYYSELHQAYVDLAWKDPNVTERSRWDELVGELNAFAARPLSEEYAPKVYFLLARVHEHVFRRHREPQALAAALEWCERIMQQYPSSEFADDALLTLGDLERDGRNDRRSAQNAYQRVLDKYPYSDSAEKARTRLGGDAKAKAKPKRKRTLLSKIFGDSKEKKEKEVKPTSGDSPFAVHPLAARLPRVPTIVLDPGHGGEEEGAHGYDGVLEKDVVLNVSLIVEELLRKRLKAKTVLTRVRDVTVELADRTQLANQHSADLFVSIHANASPSKRLRGVETYYLDNTDDKSSLRLAQRENASSGRELSDLGFMLSDLIQNAKLEDSISLAHYIQDALVSRLSSHYDDVRDLGVKKAPFFVLVGAHMPCVLVEMSFIDHKIEGRRLATREYQQLVAEAIFDGIVAYLEHRWIPQEESQRAS